MNEIVVLNDNEVKELISFNEVIKAVEEAFIQKHNKKANIWPLVIYEYEHLIYDLDIRSGNLIDSNAHGLKLLSYNENNEQNGDERIYATALICDGKSGKPIGLLNAKSITAYRTGAACAIGAKYLARKNAKKLLVLGSGNIAIHSIAAMLCVFKEIEEIKIYNIKKLSQDEINKIIDKINELLKNDNISVNIPISAVSDLEKDTKNADIIFTATPSEEAIIKDEWVKEGTHLSCMGACIKGQKEIDENIFKRAKIYGDDEKQCLEYGESQTAFNKGIIKKLNGEIGETIANNFERNEKDITIYDGTGLFIQDLATGLLLINKAKKLNKGINVTL